MAVIFGMNIFLVFWHYYTGEESWKILRQAPVHTMKRNNMVFHTLAPELAVDNLKEIHKQAG